MNYDIDMVQEILEEIYREIPKDLCRDLNGGIVLLEDIKYHEKDQDKNLLVLGCYSRFGVRKQINIYFGSIKKAYPYLDRDQLKITLKDLLMHELRHHTEYLAGLGDLAREDAVMLENYLDKNQK